MIRLWGNKKDCIGDSKQETPRLCWKLIGICLLGCFCSNHIYVCIYFFWGERGGGVSLFRILLLKGFGGRPLVKLF